MIQGNNGKSGVDGIKGDKGDVGLQGLRGIQVEINIITLLYLEVCLLLFICFVFGFLLQGDKGQPGLPGDLGGKGQKVLWFVSDRKLICVITTNKYIFLLFSRVSGVYMGALGVQDQLEKRFNLNNQQLHNEEAPSITLITF